VIKKTEKKLGTLPITGKKCEDFFARVAKPSKN